MKTSYITGADHVNTRAVAFDYNIGLLLTPDTASLRKDGIASGYAGRVDAYPFIALDNGAYSAKQSFTVEGWWAWLTQIATQLTPAQKAATLFATAPDVLTWHPAQKKDGSPKIGRNGNRELFCIGHAVPTLALFREWAPKIRALGFPVAMVAQDGLEDLLDEVPWDEMDVLFIGGSDGFKLGEGAAMCIKRAQYEGKRIHVGRVNSATRLTYCNLLLAADTADGTWLRFGNDANLPLLLAALDGLTDRPDPLAPAPVLALAWWNVTVRPADDGFLVDAGGKVSTHPTLALAKAAALQAAA